MKFLLACVFVVSTLAVVSVPLATVPVAPSEWRVTQLSNRIREGRGWVPPKCPKTFHTAEVTIGFPPKKFKMLIDLNMEGNWITSESCGSLGCFTREGYNSKDSLLHKPTGESIHLAYGDGKGHGKISTDTISIGGLHVITFQFGELEEVKGGIFLRGPFDGVIGLGQTGAATSSMNLVTALFERNLIESNGFSISLSEKTGSQLILGGVDSQVSAFGFTYHQLVEGAPWAFQLAGIRVNEADVSDSVAPVATVDLKVPLFSGSYNLTAAINQAIGTVSSNCTDIDTLPVITIVAVEGEYSIGPEDYIVDVETDTGRFCMSGIVGQATETEDIFILGEGFIRKYYAHFDLANKRVGFSAAF